MGARTRRWATVTLLAVLVSGCGLGGHHATSQPAEPSPSSAAPAAGRDVTATESTGDRASTSATPTSTPLAAMVSVDGGPMTAAETSPAVARCLGKGATADDIANAHVEYARDIAYLTDDVLTLPTVILTSKGSRIVCNRDGRVAPTTDTERAPTAEHPAVVVASEGVTGTFNGPFADGMSPFAPCVVLRVGPEVASVLMRLDWPTGDSVWYGAAIENDYAVVSAWMGGTIGAPAHIDLMTVRLQFRAYDATGHPLPLG